MRTGVKSMSDVRAFVNLSAADVEEDGGNEQ